MASFPFPSLSLFLLIQTFFCISRASVPASRTFKYVNTGDTAPDPTEYGGSHRLISIANSPFQLCFYSATPNAFTLALRMGSPPISDRPDSMSLLCWVWEANRNRPVRDNATLSFGSDGNLVLADFDGRVVWQTGTAKKDVVGLKLLSNGNMVLYDSKGKFIWQSFDYPTDTLLVGQSLRAGFAIKLVSRVSNSDSSEGPYSMVMGPKNLGLYYKSKNSPSPMLYFVLDWFLTENEGSLANITFKSEPEQGSAHNLLFGFYMSNSSFNSGNSIIVRPKYNTTFSFVRLGSEGNFRFYTFYDKVERSPWEVTYTLFSKESYAGECQLPERCGKFGLCENSQCVGCPKPNGPTDWSQDCEALKVKSCGVNDFYYYKLTGVDHFMSEFNKGNGPVKENDCGEKCSKDCKCLGYFYHKETSMCWIAYDLNTLIRVANSTHLGYIKAPKH